MESFWSTEYGQNILSVEQTEIDKLLSSPSNTTLEDLFDEDELLQQCSNKNTQLIHFLSKQENIAKLVSYITKPWQIHMTQIINHLKQQQSLNKMKNDNEPSSPLSKNGLNRVSSIEEEPEDDPLSLTDTTPQSLAETLMTLEEIGTVAKEKNVAIINESKHPITKDINTEANNDNKNAFNHYDDLKLSDDEDEELQPATGDGDGDDDSEAKAPSLVKKGSIVDMLMDGPQYNDDTEYDDTIPTHNDADPELPDLDVKNENDKESVSEENKDETDDIPPPPPPPTQPSKLEEFQTEMGTEKVKLKYPYLASEIINCQIPQILDSILNENNPFLDMLFDFIQQNPPLNAVLTNYWRSCVVALVRRNSNVILTYIKSRKNLLGALVQHIRDQSIMELVIALGWDPAIEELKELDEVADWMNEQALVPKLIATLSPLRSPDEHSAASYTLVDIVAKTSRSTNLVLFHNLASEDQIEALMNHMFGGNRSSLLESLSVLLALLHHYPNVSAEKQQFGEDYNEVDIPPPPPQDKRSSLQMQPNPLAPPQSQSVEDDNGAKEEDEQIEIETKTETETKAEDPTKVEDPTKAEETETKAEDSIETENKNQNASKALLEFNENIPPVVRAVCYRLGEFKILLETAPTQSLKLPFVELAPPLGPVRHKVVDMIVALMRTPSEVVSKKLRSLGLIVKCIDLFFRYPWNNLLHGSVEHIIQMVVSGECSILKKALFEDCDFLNRILQARQLSSTHQETLKFRLGYMGHITRVSNTIVEFAKRNKQLLEYMESNKDWMKFIADDLKLENEQLNTQLGGHRPSALNGDDGDNDDFTLFTLNDINNTEEQQINDDDDNDSDSDSDDDAHNNHNANLLTNAEIDENAANYEMPQEAFNKFTENIDQKEEQNQNKDDFDQWFNDEDSWNDFDAAAQGQAQNKGNEANTSTSVDNDDKMINGSEKGGDASNKAQIEDKTTDTDNVNAKDAFEAWDNDPFGEDLFGTDDINKDKNKINGHNTVTVSTAVAVSD